MIEIGGKSYEIVGNVTQEIKVKRTRARNARYDKTEARKISRKLYNETDAGKAIKAIKDKIRDEHAKERRLTAPFWGIDTEGVSMHEDAWIEDEDGNAQPLSKVSKREQERTLDAGGAIYVPQKIVVLAAGNGEAMHVLAKSEKGLGKDAPALSSIEMMKKLCDLPGFAPKGTNFVWYAGSYDASHILKDLPFELGWEAARQRSFDNRALISRDQEGVDLDDYLEPDAPSIRRNVIWITTDPETGLPIGFAINYLKGKWLKIGMLRRPEDKNLWYKRDKRGNSSLDCPKRILIQDVVGFFQSTFLVAVDGMRGAITITGEEQALIDWGKPLRGDFSNQDMGRIIKYNNAEIVVLSRMMEAFQKAFAELGLKPLKWHGPGVIAELELKRRGIVPVKKNRKEIVKPGHYPEFLKASKTSIAQDWAHHAFSAGRIELIRQGVHCDPDNQIYQHDICSAYPSIIVDLPSMRNETDDELAVRVEAWKRDGSLGPEPKRIRARYKKHKAQKLSLEQFKTLAEGMNMLSMFQVTWIFDLTPRPLSKEETLGIVMACDHIKNPKARGIEFDRRARELRGRPVPFCPYFYRCNGTPGNPKAPSKGTILYPSRGRGRYYRNEVLAAIAWCEKFPDAVRMFEFEGAIEFLPYLKNPIDKNSYDRPFAFVQELFDMRARIVAETEEKIKTWKENGEVGPKPYDILEKVLKLIMNSLYGKTAQSIGTLGEIPNCSNPFYAGVITAETRAQMLLAGLHNPDGVVFFATDAVMSIGPLEGLETVRKKVLGKWEFAHELDRREAAVFVHPGIYSFHDHKGKSQTKTRGFRIKFDLARDLMTRDIVQAWKKGSQVYLVKKNGQRELIPVSRVPEVRYALKKGETLEFENKIPIRNHNSPSFITLGTAISSPENWKKCGCWRTQHRDINLQSCGAKRERCYDKDRAERLVFVAPTENWEEGQLSAPYYPDWLDEDEDGFDEMKDEQNVEFKFGDLNG